MERDELKTLFDQQKDRMRTAIAELTELKATLDEEQSERLDLTIRRLQESLADDEQASADL